jgi:hypothetical protein
MSKNDNYIYPILVMSNDIIFRGARGPGTTSTWGRGAKEPNEVSPVKPNERSYLFIKTNTRLLLLKFIFV